MKSEAEILKELTEVFRDVLDNDSIVLDISTTQDDVDEWDSLAHIQLVLAIGRKFCLKFTTQEVIGWNDVASILETMKSKMQ